MSSSSDSLIGTSILLRLNRAIRSWALLKFNGASPAPKCPEWTIKLWRGERLAKIYERKSSWPWKGSLICLSAGTKPIDGSHRLTAKLGKDSQNGHFITLSLSLSLAFGVWWERLCQVSWFSGVAKRRRKALTPSSKIANPEGSKLLRALKIVMLQYHAGRGILMALGVPANSSWSLRRSKIRNSIFFADSLALWRTLFSRF